MTPKTGYFLDDDLGVAWDSITIAINAETRPEECLGYEKKTPYFLSDTNGTLTILADAVGDGDFQTYDTVTVTAGTPVNYPMTGGCKHVKLRFSAVAVVTAKFVFE